MPKRPHENAPLILIIFLSFSRHASIRKFATLLLVSLLTFLIISNHLYPGRFSFAGRKFGIAASHLLPRDKSSYDEGLFNSDSLFDQITPKTGSFSSEPPDISDPEGNQSHEYEDTEVDGQSKDDDHPSEVLESPKADGQIGVFENFQEDEVHIKGNPEIGQVPFAELDFLESTAKSTAAPLTTLKTEPPVPPTRSLEKLVYENRPPNEVIECVNNLMKSHIGTIERIRLWFKEHKHPWQPYEPNNATRFVAYGENITYFDDIAKYMQIQTAFFNETPSAITRCMINHGRLHYEYGINDCSRVLSMAKRHVMFGKILYDMKCVHEQRDTLLASPLRDAGFQVGLPENFVHATGKKTLSYVHLIRDATVTVYGDVTTGTVDLIPQRCFPNNRIYLPEDPETLPLYDEVFSMSQYYGKGMFHANIEDISRMAPYISFLQRHPEIKIHIYDLDFPPVYLSMINIDPRRFINGTVRANLLYMPGGVNCCLPTLFQTQLESFYLRRNLPNIPGKGRDTIIFIKRKHRRNRFFKNHKSIMAMVQRKAAEYGLKVWEFNDSPLPTLNETAHQFNRAFMVIAPHGAGESNLIFTQPGTILLEGLCMDNHDKLVNVVFRTLSHILGGFYYGYYNPRVHCTENRPEDLEPYLTFYLKQLDRFR